MRDLRWDEVFAWYHFNYTEIFDYTEADFENDAKTFADRGVTTIITFGAHFTYTYEPFWEDLFACIAKIVRAFHKYGIKVVEHRSYALTSRFMDAEEEDRCTVALYAGACSHGLHHSGTPDFRTVQG